MVRALERVGATATVVTSGPLSDFDRVVLPGVGATGPAMRTLRETGLDRELQAFCGPLLGVCVGMQLLFDYSTEDDTRGLGLISGVVGPLDVSPLPHIGWNSVSSDGSGLFHGLAHDELFYFVHSFAGQPFETSLATGWTTYGTDRFVSAIGRDNVSGVQFHPERSGDAGLSLLASFVRAKEARLHVA